MRLFLLGLAAIASPALANPGTVSHAFPPFEGEMVVNPAFTRLYGGNYGYSVMAGREAMVQINRWCRTGLHSDAMKCAKAREQIKGIEQRLAVANPGG